MNVKMCGEQDPLRASRGPSGGGAVEAMSTVGKRVVSDAGTEGQAESVCVGRNVRSCEPASLSDG